MKLDGFDWDKGNIGKCQKHGMGTREVESLFNNQPLIAVNSKHDLKEKRLQAIGITDEGRHAFVVFTIRNREKKKLLRPISARYMHKKEIKYYEEE